jgi:hypothetical protein
MTTLDDNTQQTSSTTALDNPKLNTLADDDIGSIDWDAPESRSGGTYTPQVCPGIHNFLFALEDEKPFETREYDTKDGHVKDFTVNHKGTVSYVADGEQKEAVIRFNQAGFRRTPKMVEKRMNSRGGDLLRSLGIHLDNPSKANVEQALREADGKVMGRGVVNWQAYCKACKEANRFDATWNGIVSTNANTKRGEARWPKGADGKYLTDVQCPKCGATLAGRERITDYKLPQV